MADDTLSNPARPIKPGMTLNAAKAQLAEGKGSMMPYLELFWSHFPWETCKSRCRSARKCTRACGERNFKLRLLKLLAAIKIGGHANPGRRAIVRSDFNENFRGDAQNPKRICFVCGGQFHHRHHIIQIQHNGQNAGINIVRLCRECHRDVHSQA